MGALAEFGGEGLQGGSAGAGQGDGGALRVQCAGNGGADAAGCAGDEGGLTPSRRNIALTDQVPLLASVLRPRGRQPCGLVPPNAGSCARPARRRGGHFAGRIFDAAGVEQGAARRIIPRSTNASPKHRPRQSTRPRPRRWPTGSRRRKAKSSTPCANKPPSRCSAIKSVLGFRQFSMRGLDKVRAEWSLVTMSGTSSAVLTRCSARG